MNKKILVSSVIVFCIHYGGGWILERAGMDYHPAVWKSLLVVGLSLIIDAVLLHKNDKNKQG